MVTKRLARFNVIGAFDGLGAATDAPERLRDEGVPTVSSPS